jgi:NhaP-type Na+/H+ or K+/H+ antiporter
MRGAVSLAVALALPFTTDTGAGFPKRNLLIFLTFAVIFVTLVGQGLSLPALLRRLDLSDGADTDEETKARLVAAKAALAQIDALAREDWTPDEKVDKLRDLYAFRKRQLAAQAGMIEDDGYGNQSRTYQQMLQLILRAHARRSCGCDVRANSPTRS